MAFLVACPACGTKATVSEQSAGHSVQCTRADCGVVFAVPIPPPAPAAFTGHAPPLEIIPAVVPAYRPDPPSYQPRRRSRGQYRSEDRDPPVNQGLASGFGVASLVVSGVALLFSVAPCLWYFGLAVGLAGLILGIVGIITAFSSRPRQGLGMPVAGAALSIVPIALAIFWMAWVGWTVRNFFDNTVPKTFEGITSDIKKEVDKANKENQMKVTGHPEVKKNLLLVGQALLDYHAKNNHLPASGGPKGNLSWRVHLLPLLGEDALYKQFKLDEAWDSPHNKKLLDQMPTIYAPVKADASVPGGYTFYQVFLKPGGSFPLTGTGPTLQQIGNQDGTAKTFMLAEASHPVPWTKPADISYTGSGAVPALGHSISSGFHAVMFDGKVYFIQKTVPENHLRLWITPDDGRPVPLP